MKKLLVPIDFSDCSMNALDYASNMANEINAEVDIVHAFRLPSAGGTPVIWDLEDSLRTERELEMEEVMSSLLVKYPNVHFSSTIVHGLTSHIIIELLENDNYSMVVMGTTGATGLKEVFFGSTTASLIDKMKTPLFVIPKSAKYESILNFIIATDLNRIIKPSKLKLIKELATSYKACIKILSFKEKLDHFEYEKDVKSLEVLIELESELAQYDYFTEVLQKENFADLEKSIFDYSNESNAVLVLIHRRKSLFRRIFGHSFSKEFAMHATNPILILQD
jgi:nucleotide-binding universal stress UspA family protein